MTAATDIAARLVSAFDRKHVVSAAEELEAYAVDGLPPGAIIRPASAEEAAEVVRFALAEKLAVLPLGSRSKCDVGLPPQRYDIALDMTGLKEIAHFDAGDLTLSVDAGMPLRDLEIFLRDKSQFLPLAVPCFESSTVGGTVASGIDSALRLQYGSVRDFLIGAEFIDGTGQMCKSGGRVVKNVTGYDLYKLLIGSLGTLGAITRLNFRTFPLPAVSKGHIARFQTAHEALQFRGSIEKAGLLLANLEVLSPRVGGMMSAILLRAEEKFPPELSENLWNVYSSAEGSEAVVQRIGRDLEKIAREAEAQGSRILEANEDEALSGMLREAFEWLRWASPANVLCRLSLSTVGKAETVGALSRLAEAHSLRSAMLVRAAGVVYSSVFSDREDDITMETLAKVVASMRALARSENGHCTLLHAPLPVKERLANSNGGQTNRGLDLRVKQAFDPSGIFAAGRVVGAI
jgi:glycolate oxidase FAD binding subunit